MLSSSNPSKGRCLTNHFGGSCNKKIHPFTGGYCFTCHRLLLDNGNSGITIMVRTIYHEYIPTEYAKPVIPIMDLWDGMWDTAYEIMKRQNMSNMFVGMYYTGWTWYLINQLEPGVSENIIIKRYCFDNKIIYEEKYNHSHVLSSRHPNMQVVPNSSTGSTAFTAFTASTASNASARITRDPNMQLVPNSSAMSEVNCIASSKPPTKQTFFTKQTSFGIHSKNKLPISAEVTIKENFVNRYVSSKLESSKLHMNLPKLCIRSLEGHNKYVNSITVMPSGLLASGGSDSIVHFWKSDDSQSIGNLPDFPKWITSLAPGMHNNLVYVAYSNFIELWDGSSGNKVQDFNENDSDNNKMASTAIVYTIAKVGNKYIASGSGDGVVKLWDGETGICMTSLQAHRGKVFKVMPMNPQLILSVCNEVAMWDIRSNSASHFGLPSDYHAISSTQDDNNVIIGNRDATITLFDIRNTSRPVNEWQHNQDKETREGGVSCLHVLPNNIIASGGRSGIIRLWDLDGTYRYNLRGHTFTVNQIVTLDNNQLASCSGDKSIRIWKP